MLRLGWEGCSLSRWVWLTACSARLIGAADKPSAPETPYTRRNERMAGLTESGQGNGAVRRPPTSSAFAVLVALALMLAGVAGAAVRLRRDYHASLFEVLDRSLAVPIAGRQPAVFLVFQVGDCDGRVQGFERTAALKDLDERVVDVRGLMINAPRDSTLAYALARASGSTLHVSTYRGFGVVSQKLHDLGVRSTPVLLAFDSTRTLRSVVDNATIAALDPEAFRRALGLPAKGLK